MRYRTFLIGFVRRLTAWAWQDIVDQRFTAQEVANWLTFYGNSYRHLTLREWVAREREKKT